MENGVSYIAGSVGEGWWEDDLDGWAFYGGFSKAVEKWEGITHWKPFPELPNG